MGILFKLFALMVFFSIFSCAKNYPFPPPISSGKYAVPIEIKVGGLIVCKVFETEANCLEINTASQYVIPIDVWNEEFDHLFHRYLDAQVKEFLDNVRYICKKRAAKCESKVKQPLKNLEEFVYENN